ncbi:MAG: hypothetical protein IPJ30_09020 [Acidobacteria bacterium]|nr:hypothetical protein [Acidobacteriota bacterium]
MIGPGNGFSLKVLDKVTFPTETNGAGPSTSFTYNSYGQVSKITNKAADGHQVNHVRARVPADATSQQTDCPRFPKPPKGPDLQSPQSASIQETVVANSH